MLVAVINNILPIIEPVIIGQAINKIPAELSAIILLLTQIPAVLAQTTENEDDTPSIYQTMIMTVVFFICFLIAEKLTSVIVTLTSDNNDSDSSDEEESDEEESDDEEVKYSTHCSNIVEEIADSLMLTLEDSDAESSDEAVKIEIESGHATMPAQLNKNLLETRFVFQPMSKLKRFLITKTGLDKS